MDQAPLKHAASPTRSAGQHIGRHVPQAVGVLRVERVRGDSVLVIRSVGDAHGFVAVLEIPTADSLEERGSCKKHGGCRALLWGLLAIGRETVSSLLNCRWSHDLDGSRIQRRSR